MIGRLGAGRGGGLGRETERLGGGYWRIEWGGEGCNRTCMAADPRTPAMPGRSKSGFHRPGRDIACTKHDPPLRVAGRASCIVLRNACEQADFCIVRTFLNTHESVERIYLVFILRSWLRLERWGWGGWRGGWIRGGWLKGGGDGEVFLSPPGVLVGRLRLCIKRVHPPPVYCSTARYAHSSVTVHDVASYSVLGYLSGFNWLPTHRTDTCDVQTSESYELYSQRIDTCDVQTSECYVLYPASSRVHTAQTMCEEHTHPCPFLSGRTKVGQLV